MKVNEGDYLEFKDSPGYPFKVLRINTQNNELIIATSSTGGNVYPSFIFYKKNINVIPKLKAALLYEV